METGIAGEQQACEFLKTKGYTIVDRNFRSRFGEVDIIARLGEDLVFAEVKTRNSRAFGRPSESVGWKKQQRIRKTALYYLMLHPSAEANIRFDVVEVEKTGITHIENAFGIQ
jgi:putative endonuclease